MTSALGMPPSMLQVLIGDNFSWNLLSLSFLSSLRCLKLELDNLSWIARDGDSPQQIPLEFFENKAPMGHY